MVSMGDLNWLLMIIIKSGVLKKLHRKTAKYAKLFCIIIKSISTEKALMGLFYALNMHSYEIC
jgi:hypothetical protein